MKMSFFLLLLLALSLAGCDMSCLIPDDDDNDDAFPADDDDDDDNDDDNDNNDDDNDDDNDNDNDNDDNDNDDNDDNDDDDNDDLTGNYYGAIDLDGEPGYEYLYYDYTVTGSFPNAAYHYTVQVRRAADDTVVWEQGYDVGNGSMIFSLADLDGDGTFEIIENFIYYNPTGGEVMVKDGNAGFETVLDTGLFADVSLYAEGAWDIDADGRPELMVKANPAYGSGQSGWIRWYNGFDDYATVKELAGAVESIIEVKVGSVGSFKTPVDFDGDGAPEYLYYETYFTTAEQKADYNYDVRVRRADDDTAVWTTAYNMPTGAYMAFTAADLDADDTYEIIETTNYSGTDKTSGQVDVRDGDEDFIIVFNTQEVTDATLSARGGYDMNRNGRPELWVRATPSGDTAGWMRWYEAGADYQLVLDWPIAAGGKLDVVTRLTADNLLGPVDLDGDAGLEYVAVVGAPLAAGKALMAWEVSVIDAADGQAIWTNTYGVNGSVAAILADLDRDQTYELVEQINYQVTSGMADVIDYQGRVDVRDGNQSFDVVFDTQLTADTNLYAWVDWDIDRNGWPELLVYSYPEEDSSVAYFYRWYEGLSDFANNKNIEAAGAAGLYIRGGYLP